MSSENQQDAQLDSNTSGPEEESMELSLDELGRAYAKAVGLVPDEPEAELPKMPQEADDELVCPISPKSVLEAILFVGTPEGGEKLTSRKIASWLRDVSPQEITAAAKELAAQYEAEHAAYRIEYDKQSMRLVLSDQYDDIRENFYGEVRQARLSQQSVDVLAIVAYNQPVNRARVEKLRGRGCNAILKQLVKRRLLSAEASGDSPKIMQYRTTDRFLELFGLDSIEDLPQSEEAMLPEIED